MGVPKLSDDVYTTADALNLVEQYKAWLADLIEETVPHPGYGNMADAALKLAETLATLQQDAAIALNRLGTSANCMKGRDMLYAALEASK